MKWPEALVKIVVSICLMLGFLAWVGTACAAESIPRDCERHRRDLTREARAVWGLGAPVTTFAASLEQESLCRAGSISRAGAEGAAQIMPATGRWLSQIYPELGPPDPFAPRWAIRAMVRYDRFHWERLTGADDCQRMAKTRASYNQGLGWTRRQEFATPAPKRDRWFGGVEDFNPGKSDSAYNETRDYVRQIILRRERKYFAAHWSTSPCWRWP